MLAVTYQHVERLSPESGALTLPNFEDTFTQASHLSPQALEACLNLRDWIMEHALSIVDMGEVVAEIANRLNAIGIPIDRMTTAVESLHSQHAGVGRYWEKGEESRMVFFPHEGRIEALYAASPIYYVHQTREWLHLDVTKTPDTLFSIIPDLKAGGYTHYLCIPLFFSNGTGNALSFATKARGGFSPEHLRILRFIIPTLTFATELRATHRHLNDVLRIYVGDAPHREILSGVIRRGQVTRIRSCLLMADMRHYTRISSQLTPEETVAWLNDYFDYLVPAIEDQGGEVLKYMGDGLLAVFRDEADDKGETAQKALHAARDIFARIREARVLGSSLYPVDVGIALHHGEAAYGNVGSGTRLDFTVIGRDVNIACRVARLNKVVHQPLLMTHQFAAQLAFTNSLAKAPTLLGNYDLEGLNEAVAIYV
jgi:adenylate cyclase